MKNKVKYLRLIGKGFSSKTLNSLTEQQINVLYNKMMSEQVRELPAAKKYEIGAAGGQLPPAAKGYYVKQDPTTKKTIAMPAESEMSEEISDDDALGADALQDYTGQEGPHDEDDMAPDGMGIFEEGKKRKKSSPWAICTTQLGKEFKTTKRHLWSAKQKNKYERCVRDVKKSLKEGKNPVSLFLENQIMRIVEKHIPPRITKYDLLKYLNEDTETAPSKPKTKPKPEPKDKPKKPKSPHRNPNPDEESVPKAGTKKNMDEDTTTAPTQPVTKPTIRPKPKSPGGNPNPGEESVPKAGVSAEKAKNIVIQAIGKILEK